MSRDPSNIESLCELKFKDHNSNINKTPLFIILEGIIGAGKSTLLQHIKRKLESENKLKVHIVLEPVDQWVSSGILEEFYNNIPGKAYEFQTFVYSTRIQTIRKGCMENPDVDVFLIERSPISDRHTFAKMLQESNCFTRVQGTIYNTWCDTWDLLLPFAAPDGILYLAPSISEAMKRISGRNRANETNKITVDYQEKLKSAHDELLGPKDGNNSSGHDHLQGISRNLIRIKDHLVPVLKIESDADYRQDNNHPILQLIVDFIANLNKK